MGTPDISMKHYFSKSVLPNWHIFGKPLGKTRYFKKNQLPGIQVSQKNRLVEETGLVIFWDFFNVFYSILAYFAYLIYKSLFLGKTFLQNCFWFAWK